MNIRKRENYKNLLDEHFWQYYRFEKRVKPKEYNTAPKCYKGVRDIFRTLQEMLSESTHGAILDGFGIIVPKDTLIFQNKGIFTREEKVMNNYLFFFENMWLADYYRSYFKVSNHCKSEKENLQVREPKPMAIKLHRKKIRKD